VASPPPAAPPASAAEAGQSALILAREDAGILEMAEAEPLAKAVAAAIGEGKLGQLRQVWREAHATRDDDAKALVRLGRRWCRILGVQPDQAAPKADPAQPGQGAPSPVAGAVGEAATRVAAASAADFRDSAGGHRPGPRARSCRTSSPAGPGDPLLTIDEVIAELRVSRAAFYRWRRQGAGPAVVRLPGGGVRVRRSALAAWLRRLEEQDTQDGQEQTADGQLRHQVLGHQEDRQRHRSPLPGPVGGQRP
jgi:predicted DNA-binding transcriptional regulator AlpA